MPEPKPVILRELFPIDEPGEMIDGDLQQSLVKWTELAESSGGVPQWSMDFAMDNSRLVSRTMMYDTSGGETYLPIIGEECREVIGLPKSKGFLKDLMPPANYDDVQTRIIKCGEMQKPHYVLKSMSWNNDRDFMNYEVLFLPFVTEDSTRCTWFFVPMVFHHVDEM